MHYPFSRVARTGLKAMCRKWHSGEMHVAQLTTMRWDSVSIAELVH
jgi:hypothetical protein